MSFLLLLLLSHLILCAWAPGEKRLASKGQPGPAATGRNAGGASSRQSSSSATSSSASSAASSPAAPPGGPGSGSEQSSFQWSPSGRRTGSLYCRVGIGFHLQIYPDGKVNGSHEANMLSKLLAPPQNLPERAAGTGEGQRVLLRATGAPSGAPAPGIPPAWRVGGVTRVCGAHTLTPLVGMRNGDS